MRIALLCCDPEMAFGDGQRCPVRLRGLAQSLARAGHDLTVICSGDESECSEGQVPGIRVRMLRMPVSVREIDWHFSQVDPDVVIERLTPSSLEGVRAASEAGIPHLYDIDGDLSSGGLATSAAVRGALPEALALTSGAITSSPGSAERIREFMGGTHPVAVVPNAAGSEFLESPSSEAVARVAEQLCLPERGMRVGFFGALTAESGLLPLVESVAALPRDLGARLVVMGDGPERNPALRVADRTHTSLVLCGRVAHRSVPAHLALCDIVVAPGGQDGGAPLTLLEAMAMRRAVVAPATDGVRSLASDGYDARLVPAGNGEALTSALASLAADAGLRERLGHNARTTVRAAHTWDSRAAEVTSFLENLHREPARDRTTEWREHGARSAVSG